MRIPSLRASVLSRQAALKRCVDGFFALTFLLLGLAFAWNPEVSNKAIVCLLLAMAGGWAIYKINHQIDWLAENLKHLEATEDPERQKLYADLLTFSLTQSVWDLIRC